MKNRRHNPLLVFAVLAALLLGACSSGGDDDNADDPTTTTEATENGGDDSADDSGDEGGDETTTTEGGDESGESVDVGADGQAYVDAMVASMGEDEEFPFTDGQAECYSTRFVDTIGVDRLQAAGITPEQMAGDDDTLEYTELELSLEEGNQIYDHLGDCGIDLRAMMMESFAASDDDITPEMQACLEGVFTDENLRTLMVSSMVNGEDAMEGDPELSPLVGQLMGCAFMGMGDMEGMEGMEELELEGLGE